MFFSFMRTIGDSCDLSFPLLVMSTFFLLLIFSHLQVGSRRTSENTVRNSLPLSFAIRMVRRAVLRNRPVKIMKMFSIGEIRRTLNANGTKTIDDVSCHSERYDLGHLEISSFQENHVQVDVNDFSCSLADLKVIAVAISLN